MKKSIQFYFCAFNARPDAGLLLKRDDGEHNASDHYDRSNHGRPQVTKSVHRLRGHRGRRVALRRARCRLVKAPGPAKRVRIPFGANL